MEPVLNARIIGASVAALVAALTGCADEAPPQTPETPNLYADDPALADNALLAPWSGPFGGVPAFDRLNVADVKPALEAAMAENLAEIEAIAANKSAPTFENTIVALERAGRTLNRVLTNYGVMSSNLSSPAFREVRQEMAPKIAAFNSQIIQNEALFTRVKAVHESKATPAMRPDQQRLVHLVYEQFARNGATLTGPARERYAEINARLAELQTTFADNILHDEEAYVLFLDETQTGGLSTSYLASAKAAAAERGRDDAYAVLNTRSSMDPFLTFSTERDLRERVWRTYYNRGDNGEAHDNNAVITEILALRDERVGLLGYETYAAWRLENRMAKTPERAFDLMETVWPAAVARVGEEVADMQRIADQEAAEADATPIKIAPWDYRYYAEKVRQSKYDLDSDEVKQYLELNNLREAMFFVAGELFGFAFAPARDIPVFHPDVKVWEVTDAESGDHVGLWYLDAFARTGKRSGAWATTYRGRSTFDGAQTVLASNNSNFVKPAEGEPVLVSFDDAETFFHEFGHALHYLAADVAYPTLNRGVRDYTEFQSQLLERWLLTAPVIEQFLTHHETGAPMPPDLIAKIEATKTFNQGFSTTEYLASALVDMKYHTSDPSGIDPDAFERAALEELGMPSEIVMRHRSPHFGHIFSGEGYSAGYYGYLWADVLTSDAADAFAEAPGGFYDKDLARRLVDNLFAPRNAVDPEAAYRAFRGRDATIDALMRDRGFAAPPDAPPPAAPPAATPNDDTGAPSSETGD